MKMTSPVIWRAALGLGLDYFRTGLTNCPLRCSVREYREACDYFILPFK